MNMYIDKLPVWRGLNRSLDQRLDLFQFELIESEYGFITQKQNSFCKVLIESYSDEKYSFITTLPGMSNWGNTLGESRYKFLISNIDKKMTLRIVDVGAGNLFIPEKICSDYNVIEYNVIDPAMKNFRKDAINVKKEYFNYNSLNRNDYDYFISLNCIEHIPDPYQFLIDAKKAICSKNGKILLVFPDTERQLMNGDYNVILHEHINYFTRQSFSKLVNKVGLKLDLLESCSDSFYAVLSIGNESGTSVTTMTLNLLEKAFNKSLKYFDQLLSQRLVKGEKVALHGACNGLNNLLSLSNSWSGYEENMYIYDGDESKTGLYLPAFNHKPIFSSSDEKYKEMDSVIIAAMTFITPISKFIQSQHGINSEDIFPAYLN